MDDCFIIGTIVNTQGIKGEVRVIPETFDIKRFELLEYVYVNKNSEIIKYEIEKIRYHKQFVLIKFKGIDDMTSAEKLKKCDIVIPKEMALPLEENEYYLKDLYYIDVITDIGENLGKIEDIIFTGANDVYVVRNEEKEILIPAIKKCILNVDIKNKVMTVNLLEGLRE